LDLLLSIDTAHSQDSKVPKCRICDGVMKMDVVLFGEALTNSTLEGAIAAAMTADVLLVVGTSLTVRIILLHC
jgi:NAD-dependent deacetylase